MTRRYLVLSLLTAALLAGATAPEVATSASSQLPVNTALPAISGTAQQGQTLTATSGSWSSTQTITYSYQWQRCGSNGASCADVGGATGLSYTLTAADVGSTMRFAVTATNKFGSTKASSAPTTAVSPPPAVAPSLVSVPVVSGTAQQGQTLTASTGSWNGTQPLSYTYLWYRCNSSGGGCVALAAYAASYVVVAGDVGSTLRVNVGAQNSVGSASATSAATAVVTSSSSSGAPSLVSVPVVSGTAQQGQTLTASTGSWNGTQPLSYTYLWYRCNSSGGGCVALAAYAASYVVVAGDVGSTLRVNVGAQNSVGSASATSAATAVVTSSSSSGAPSLVSVPVVSGTAQQGQTLTASTGSWNGTQPLSYTYLWYRCNSSGGGCVALAAYAASYVVVAGDVGSTLRVNVGAQNSVGSASATSAATAVVTSSSSSGAPSLVSVPVVSGTAQQGQTLTASTGSWNGTQPLSYTYLWYRCNSSGGGCVALAAYAASYVVVAGDVGSTLRVNVGAQNSVGSANATSAATAVVTSSSSQTTAPQCSRSSLASCPASYFAGPLGSNNLIPNKPGAFLIDEYGGIGTSWAQVQAGVLQREADMGRTFDGVGFHYDGGGSFGGVFGMTDPGYYSPRPEQWIHDHGSFPTITWTPNYTIAQMNNGVADAIWAKAANYFKTFNFTIMLRSFHEFDLPFVPWAAVPSSGNGNVNSCGGPFIAAWQRMVNIFRANGATNVGFWWTPFEGPADRSCAIASYPGDSYVDWVGTDEYNVCLVGRTDQWCTPLHSGWASFEQLFNYTALGSTLADGQTKWGPHKPFVVGETATWYDSNYPSYKGDWFRNLAAGAKKIKYLRGITFFDEDVSANPADGPLGNYRVDNPTSNPDVYAGFKQMAADPWFNTSS